MFNDERHIQIYIKSEQSHNKRNRRLNKKKLDNKEYKRKHTKEIIDILIKHEIEISTF